MIKSVTKLCLEDYCLEKQILKPNSVTFTFIKLNDLGDPIFNVKHNCTDVGFYYTSNRKDLTYLSYLKSSFVYKKELPQSKGLTKSMVVNFIYNKTGFKMLEEDISLLRTDKEKVTVIMSPNSMRFKNSFIITLI